MGAHTLGQWGEGRELAPGKCKSIFVTNYVLAFSHYFRTKTLLN